MTSHQIKMPAKDVSKKDDENALARPNQPKIDRYLLQVDRQTKNSYPTSDAAQKAALAIKFGHPVVQVSVYDSVEGTHTTVALPAAAS